MRNGSLLSALLLATSAAACLPSFDKSGGAGGANGSGGPNDALANNPAVASLPAGVALDAAPTAIHRLSPEQYRHTVRDLLGVTDADVADITLPVDDSQLPSLLAVSKLDDNALALASLGAHRKLLTCDVNAGTPECVSKFIDDFGMRAFRHPVTPDEHKWLQGIYDGAKAQFSFADSIDVVARVILQSPSLVYVHEEGEAIDGLPAGLMHLTQFEVASRISYLLWDSMPDSTLFDAAAKKQLTGDGLRAQVKRMVDDPRARTKMIQFATAWMELDGSPKHVSIEEAVKNATLFPLDNPKLRSAARKEMEEFVGHVWDKGGSVNELFTSTDAYVNGPLAQLYGVTGGPTGDNWAWVQLPSAQRAGIATRAAFLLVYSNPDIPSPIRRGAAVWREFMCTVFPPPPPAAMDVKIQGGTTDASGNPLSIRDTVILRTTQDAQCAGCHNIINPAGFALGHFDALGQWQDVEKGKTPAGKSYTANIDAHGALIGSDIPGEVDGAVAFSQSLGASRQLKDCVAARFWRGAFGRDVSTEEQSSLKYVQEKLASSGSMRDALTAIVESPSFQFMRKGAP